MPEDKTPLPHEGDMKPVVWTPEDASRFLTAAIHEAQRPLADALKQRPVTSKALTAIVALMALATIVIAVILSNQLDKTEKATEELRATHNTVLSEKIEYQTEAKLLKERLDNAQATMATLRGSEDEVKRAKTDAQRYRRQNDLLRTQISGLEMEKMALARQLEAVKAMAEDDMDGEFEDKLPDPTPETKEPAPTASATIEEPREDAQRAVQPGETFPVVDDQDVETPQVAEPAAATAVTTPAAEPAATPEPQQPAEPVAAPDPEPTTEPATETEPVSAPEPAATEPEQEEPAATADEAAPAEEPAAPASSETVSEPSPAQEQPEETSETTAAEEKQEDNPPTLYESSQMFQATSEAYGEQLARETAGEADADDVETPADENPAATEEPEDEPTPAVPAGEAQSEAGGEPVSAEPSEDEETLKPEESEKADDQPASADDEQKEEDGAAEPQAQTPVAY